ncbi:MAG: hypothetical protein EU541_06535 [Promethearchaeota archaeon]|nr:MAG: hypothetical protein EU541_06535 [Candidatus Lokiarchaeota archaeon]
MTGASRDLQNKIKELSKNNYRAITIIEKCKSCGTCIIYCPLKIRTFNIDGKAITINTKNSCGGCSVCFHRCPQHAIKLVLVPKKNYPD